MKLRKRSYQDFNGGENQIITIDPPLKFKESKKFYFKYSLTNDNKKKPKSKFIGFEELELIPEMFSLNYDKDEEIMTLPKFYSSPEFSQTKEDAIEFLDTKINEFVEKKKTLRFSLLKKKIRKPKKQKLSHQDKVNSKILIAIKMLQNKAFLKDVSCFTGLTIGQVCKLNKKLKDGISPIINKKGRKTTIKKEYLEFLKELVSSQNDCIFYHIIDVKMKLMSKFDEFKKNPPSITTVRKIISLSGITRKRTIKIKMDRNSQNDKSDRFKASFSTVSHLRRGREIIYIDETGFNKDFVPRYGFSIKNKACFVPAPKKSKNYSCIVAISREGIIGLQIFEGSVKSGDFACFILSLIRYNYFPRYKPNQAVLFMDNAKIHHSELLLDLQKFIDIQYNAPYSPYLNPIEECFGVVKKKFRSLNIENSSSFLHNILKSFRHAKQNQIEGFIINSFKYLKKSLEFIDI